MILRSDRHWLCSNIPFISTMAAIVLRLHFVNSTFDLASQSFMRAPPVVVAACQRASRQAAPPPV